MELPHRYRVYRAAKPSETTLEFIFPIMEPDADGTPRVSRRETRTVTIRVI